MFMIIWWLANRLLQDFAHVMKAQLSWHVQTFVAVTVFQIYQQQSDILQNS